MGLSFGRKRDLKLVAAITGKCIAIEEVNDNVFASKMMGDGIAFHDFETSTICAPCDGHITLMADTLHAFGMTSNNGAEILIHIGLDTVVLKGRGFRKLVNQGDKVHKGTPIIEIDMDFMKSKGIDLTTPMVITNGAEYNFNINNEIDHVIQGDTNVITFL